VAVRVWLLAASVLAAACTPRPDAGAVATVDEAKAVQATRLEPDAARHERGRAIYNYRCYFCHGYGGDAKTLAAAYLSPPPRDFTSDAARALDRDAIARAVREGRAGTAMKSFDSVLGRGDIDAVAAFVRREFIEQRAPNTRYHTAANGWPDHDQRYAGALPFATGRVAIDADPARLSDDERRGQRLYMTSCISCHDRGRFEGDGPPRSLRSLPPEGARPPWGGPAAGGPPRSLRWLPPEEARPPSGGPAAGAPAWSSRPVSYPRAGFVYDPEAAPVVDAVSSATPYAMHDVPPKLAGLTARQRKGERLFQANCAFCHGADGSGMNWIGQFMEPKARDLRAFTSTTMPATRLRSVIRDGLDGTSMPAWKHVLRPAEIDAVGAYVARAFFADAGTALARASDRKP
jgi:cytochrome c oxidase cbb3-type subunit 3